MTIDRIPPSARRDAILGATETFVCAPFMGRAEVETIPYQPHVISADHFYGPIAEAVDDCPAAVDRAVAAMGGLHRLIVDRSRNRVTVLETRPGEDWEAGPLQNLRRAIFAVAGSTFIKPNLPTQAVRNDIRSGEPNGTIIVKGQADKLPLFVVEKEIHTGGRRIEAFNGQLPNLDDVMHEVNAFSPNEWRLARKYLSRQTIDRSKVSSVLEQANRYTTPDPDALFGAYQYEISGDDAPKAWLTHMDAYATRRGRIPE